MRGYHQYQVESCVFYRTDSVILTYVDNFLLVPQKQEKTTSLIESLKNGTGNDVLTNEGDISNYLEVNINKNLDGTFELSKSHLVEKIINHVGIKVSACLKSRETPYGNPLLH